MPEAADLFALLEQLYIFISGAQHVDYYPNFGEFLHLLYFVDGVLSKINKTAEQIEDISMDLVKACDLVSALIEYLTDLRTCPYDSEVETLCNICNIDANNNNERPRRVSNLPQHLESFVAVDSMGRSRTDNAALNIFNRIYITLIDCLLGELEKRFSTDA